MPLVCHTRKNALPHRSLLAMCICAALPVSTALAAPQSEDTVLVEASADSGPAEESQDYSVKTTAAGTKMLLVQRDIPQSVSVVSKQRMQDQQLQSLGDVLSNTTGISASVADSDRVSYYSRGFLIDNYMVDGIPTFFETRWNLGDALSDTALLERVEIVRGATGLMTGPGNPSAAVNMVRKHADSREFTGNVSAEYGSWDKQRYVADVQSPLTDDGRIRGRMIAGYQNNDSWLDRYNNEKKFFYGVLDVDLTAMTSFSVGYEYQDINVDSQTWGGLPRWYTDGSLVGHNKHDSTAPNWAYNDKDFNKVFATLKQRFENNWELTLNATHTEMNLDSKALYLDGLVDKSTGMMESYYGASYPVVGGTGYNTGKRKVDALDLYASGPYELLGRQHQLMVGANYSKQHNRYLNSWANIGPDDLGSYYDYNGNFPETQWGDLAVAQDDKIHIKSAYTATRISLADPLHLIVGARYTKWSSDTLTQNIEKNNTTPYAGLVFDINENWSTYASYTSVFQPQTVRDINGKYLSPITGNNYELGVKSDWMDSRLTTSLAVFRIEQDNLGVTTGQVIPGSAGESAYAEADGTVSKGVEFEVNGAITDYWQMTVGATRYVAEDRDGNAFNPNLPRTTVKLFTSYNLPMLQQLTVGGGVNWQNRVYQNVATPYGTFRAEQGSYALVDLFGRYQVNKNFAIQANLNNLFDKEYDTNIEQSYIYGAPRNFSVTANYSF
ncbi:ferric-rhodotorulic acid/ferric-coprogen receptor FhuE [Atlantibacter sp. RC6]|uniref:ferric-rhodotorulic acid/ferric-coprogen receptor FhuE n=1 Tax=Atlantibacter sp. RC6 TaxID=2587036 RepID=UPI001606AD2E|nr:ferric-rhodotorulic acid/ferric-coprogen receptor FhuE [Atlantibacter sp. RC6]MBB3324373.1 outer membrane receptor for ferric coprogen and ferric-rhodotorulic acid [Atlantibacter sp. RC6]